MRIYWYRRVAGAILAILALTLGAKACSVTGDMVENHFSPGFKCLKEMTLTVEVGDTLTKMAEEQVETGNCDNWEPLSYYLVENNPAVLQPGDKVFIPKEG